MKHAKLEQIEKIMMNGPSRESIVKYQNLAKSQGCPQEIVDKIPAMFAAVMAQAVIENYDGPTDKEVNPGFFLDGPGKILDFEPKKVS